MTDKRLIELLELAYQPCRNFELSCKGHCVWDTRSGLVPNGFGGAKGDLSEVELVIVTGEPGAPTDSSQYQGTPRDMVEKSIQIMEDALRSGGVNRDGRRFSPFHKNLRLILKLFWGDVDIEFILRKTWFTNSVLCPRISKKGHKQSVISTCIRDFLKPQLDLCKSAFVLALGSARERMEKNGLRYDIGGVHPVNRSSNDSKQKSWQEAADEFYRYRNGHKRIEKPTHKNGQRNEFRQPTKTVSIKSLTSDSTSDYCDVPAEVREYFLRLSKISGFEVRKMSKRRQIRFLGEIFGGLDVAKSEWYILPKFAEKFDFNLDRHMTNSDFYKRERPKHTWWALKGFEKVADYEAKVEEIYEKELKKQL